MIDDTGFYVRIQHPERSLSPEIGRSVSVKYPHRPVRFEYLDTDRNNVVEVYTNGRRYNAHGPQVMRVRGVSLVEEWRDESERLHRVSAPARIVHTELGGFLEEWRHHGELTRDGGPALTEYERSLPANLTWSHYQTDVRVKSNWLDSASMIESYKRIVRVNVLHNRYVNVADPTVTIYRDVAIQRTPELTKLFVKSAEYRWLEGGCSEPLHDRIYHRNNGPARVMLNQVRLIMRGNEIVSSQHADDWSVEWHHHGRLIPTLTIVEWCRKNSIVLGNHPCHDRSAFPIIADEKRFASTFRG